MIENRVNEEVLRLFELLKYEENIIIKNKHSEVVMVDRSEYAEGHEKDEENESSDIFNKVLTDEYSKYYNPMCGAIILEDDLIEDKLGEFKLLLKFIRDNKANDFILQRYYSGYNDSHISIIYKNDFIA